MMHKTTMPYERLNITMPKETKEKLKRIAKKEKRSHANMISVLIDRYEE